jgi:hypothetical protein
MEQALKNQEDLNKTLFTYPQIENVSMSLDEEGNINYLEDISDIPDAPTPAEFKLKFQDIASNLIDVEYPPTIAIPSGGGESFVGCKYLNTLHSGWSNWESWMGTSSFIPGKYGGHKLYDTDNIYDNSTGYFTIPSGKAGYYNFEVNLIATVFNISGYYTAYLMRLRGGVNTKLAQLHTAYPVGRNYFIANLTRQFLCNEGDQFYYWTNSTVNSYSTYRLFADGNENLFSGGLAFYKVG